MSHPTVVCGKDCTIQIASNSYSAHSFNIALSGRETDVTSFGSSTYGDYEVCIVDGVITVQTYETLDVAPNDVVTIAANVGATSLTYGNCKVISTTDEVDSKGIVNHTSTFRITQAAS